MVEHIKLTQCDRDILTSYRLMLDGLADYIGPGYEIILHSLENFDNSAIKVINGHYSGRSEGAPLTDFALQMMPSKQTPRMQRELSIKIERPAVRPCAPPPFPFTAKMNGSLGCCASISI